jgi:hypothetical protein
MDHRCDHGLERSPARAALQNRYCPQPPATSANAHTIAKQRNAFGVASAIGAESKPALVSEVQMRQDISH